MTVSKEAYEQNYQQFRSLNQIMWQTPVLAMTLTGGLWFGASTSEYNPLLVTILLLTASFGNVVLSGVLLQFRHVMGCYLDWLEQTDPKGFVDASAGVDSGNLVERFCNRDKLFLLCSHRYYGGLPHVASSYCWDTGTTNWESPNWDQTTHPSATMTSTRRR